MALRRRALRSGRDQTQSRLRPRIGLGTGRPTAGASVHFNGRTLYDHGVVTPTLLNTLVSRKAFIYSLEIVAQVIALVSFGRRLPMSWIAFIDNVASRPSPRLRQRPGRQWHTIRILSTAARHDWQPHFERVTSKANIRCSIPGRPDPSTPEPPLS